MAFWGFLTTIGERIIQLMGNRGRGEKTAEKVAQENYADLTGLFDKISKGEIQMDMGTATRNAEAAMQKFGPDVLRASIKVMERSLAERGLPVQNPMEVDAFVNNFTSLIQYAQNRDVIVLSEGFSRLCETDPHFAPLQKALAELDKLGYDICATKRGTGDRSNVNLNDYCDDCGQELLLPSLKYKCSVCKLVFCKNCCVYETDVSRAAGKREICFCKTCLNKANRFASQTAQVPQNQVGVFQRPPPMPPNANMSQQFAPDGRIYATPTGWAPQYAYSPGPQQQTWADQGSWAMANYTSPGPYGTPVPSGHYVTPGPSGYYGPPGPSVPQYKDQGCRGGDCYGNHHRDSHCQHRCSHESRDRRDERGSRCCSGDNDHNDGSHYYSRGDNDESRDKQDLRRQPSSTSRNSEEEEYYNKGKQKGFKEKDLGRYGSSAGWNSDEEEYSSRDSQKSFKEKSPNDERKNYEFSIDSEDRALQMAIEISKMEAEKEKMRRQQQSVANRNADEEDNYQDWKQKDIGMKGKGTTYNQKTCDVDVAPEDLDEELQKAILASQQTPEVKGTTYNQKTCDIDVAPEDLDEELQKAILASQQTPEVKAKIKRAELLAMHEEEEVERAIKLSVMEQQNKGYACSCIEDEVNAASKSLDKMDSPSGKPLSQTEKPPDSMDSVRLKRLEFFSSQSMSNAAKSDSSSSRLDCDSNDDHDHGGVPVAHRGKVAK